MIFAPSVTNLYNSCCVEELMLPYRCRYCEVDKGQLWSPSESDQARRRTKESTKTMSEVISSLPSEAQRRQRQTDTGIIPVENVLFSEEIFMEPHRQVSCTVYFYKIVYFFLIICYDIRPLQLSFAISDSKNQSIEIWIRSR